jgi:hypothetical protein
MRARVTGRSLPAWIGGGAVGFLTLVRQLDGFVVAVLLGLWAIGLGGRRLKPGALAGFVASLVIVAGVTLPYNRYFTGRATAFPVMTYFDRKFGVNTHAYGFGPERGMGWGIDPFPGHGPVDAVVNANLNATAINVELFGWATGSLLPIFLFAAAIVAGRGRIGDRLAADRLSAVLLAAVFGAYFFNYFSGGPDFGARYWFLTILPCIVLAVRGLHVLATMASAGSYGSERVATAVLALSAAAVLVFVPWRALDKYHHYLDMRADVRRLAQERAFGRSMVFIRGNQFPDYASAAIYNPLDLRTPNPVYVHDRGSAVRSQLQAAYPDRPVWVVDGPSLTDAGFRIVAGPLEWSRFFDEIIKAP